MVTCDLDVPRRACVALRCVGAPFSCGGGGGMVPSASHTTMQRTFWGVVDVDGVCAAVHCWGGRCAGRAQRPG